MGNHISLCPATVKIVFYDGSVQEFEQPVTVAELMLEHPQQVVVEFHSAMNQKRPTPLPADKKLEMNKVYVMLPKKRGKPIGLSEEESNRILFILNSGLSSKYLPWFARLCHTSTIEEVEPKVINHQKKEERYGFSVYLPEMLEGMPEYLSRELSGKGWKPTLDTIKEKKIETKVSHWLFL
ncbi:hypothetical protein Lal_00047082 [Lupinus albus]|uniref:Uncharacterized protein n=1 Tax=Lupinus albus TaxID=3870 RepID=A0A6A5MUC9_LUPAL|nr:hypothetical protein Lalb_Chr02g0146781 [Lupinus albus]KAF1878414.1 hypothetical protein Lal_00047082 [Lupinus albus]